MVELIYNCEVSCPVVRSDLLKIVEIASKKEKKIKGILEVTVVSEKTIKLLNKKYRGKNKVTDVLSFSLLEGKQVVGPVLGEIYICYKKIINQAKEFVVTPKEEFQRMLVHGMLHLVGYDHIKKNDAIKMFKLQEIIISSALRGKKRL
jgi:probable rRNA maturation factor